MVRHTILCLISTALALAAQDIASPNPAERKRAARELKAQGTAALPSLTKLLSDPDVEVRIEAVKAIVEIDTQHSLDPLIQATRDSDPEVQIRATDGLVNFYLPGYVRTGFTASLRRVGGRIKGRFTDETNEQVIDPFIEVRPDVIQALGRLARGGASMEARANAARAVGILRGRAAVPDLLEAIQAKDSQLIYECLVALQKIGDPAAAPRVAFLLRDLDERVQAAAIETMGLLRYMDALPQLREILARTGKKRVRRAALRSIAMLPDRASRELLRRYLNDRDGELREAAAEGLGRIQDPEDLAVLEKMFAEERDNSARLSAAFGLVMLGKADLSEFGALRYLINTLNSSARVGEARALLIEAARKPEVRRLLYEPLLSGTVDERIGLAQVLAHSGDHESISVLERATRDPDPKVAQEALRALRALRARLS
ncbi:MAG: HEAT repeat domain-containing protein [Bryobacterales bacterium]|nr:HEAT repeat domain-containing protein [Bryobacteraceae bacterium]MDW8355468.1 HEAT repeat domain-containing protein [Bryobacterales bacterium]